MKQRSPRILHVLFADTVGGCERLTLDLAAYFAELGLNQEAVFLRSGEGPVRERFREIGLPVHVCPYDRKARFKFVRRFARLCRQRAIDGVLTHAFGVHFFIGMGARFGGAERILVLVGNPPPRERRARVLSGVLGHAARPLVYREVACSHYVANAIHRFYRLPRSRIAVVHNWCNVVAIRQAAAESRARRQESGPILSMVARMDAIKDHETVVQAFAEFVEQYPSAKLLLIGDGAKREQLETLAATLGIDKAVEFLGTRLDVAHQLGRMDVFVYATTEQEGFGIVLAEAMAAGVPILCTEIGPCAEVLDDGRAGYLVPHKNPQAMARGLLRLWENATLRQQLQQQASALVHERYSLEAGGKQILRLLHG